MNLSRHQSWSEIALVVGAPLLLAVVELFHPHPHDLLNLDVDTWLAVHYAQIPLFPLSALAVAALAVVEWALQPPSVAWRCLSLRSVIPRSTRPPSGAARG
jgi:hypothetical protein